MIYYCTRTMGGTSRGVGIIKALGEGVLVTPYRKIAILERLPWFRHPPIPQPDDVLIYDRITRYHEQGKRVSVGYEGDVDLVIDWPVLSHALDDLDIEQALDWWRAPILVGGSMIHSILEKPPKQRILGCRGGPMKKAHKFKKDVKKAHPHARLAVYDPQQFYWPALGLMVTADDVVGERQVQNEWAVVSGDEDPDGAEQAAAEIHKLL